MNRFLITGLPRSRTAWMAAVCNTVDCALCVHEPTREVPSWDGVCDCIWENDRNFGRVGISDHGMGFHLEEILANYQPRTLVIERDIDEVEASLRRILPDTPCRRVLEVLHRRIEICKHSDLVLTVGYRELDERIEECLSHLMPDADFDIRKIRMLQGFNIQCDGSGIRLAREHFGTAKQFLGADVMAEIRST